MTHTATRWLGIAALLAFGAGISAQAADVTVNATGFKDQTGMAIVYLWKAPGEGFPNKTEKATTSKTVKIEPSGVKVTFDAEPGVYAVSVTHDENNNGKMDTGFMGKPKEGYGASNNPQNKLSAPSFDQCKITVDAKGATVDIKMRGE